MLRGKKRISIVLGKINFKLLRIVGVLYFVLVVKILIGFVRFSK